MKTASQAIAIVTLLALGADRVSAEGGALAGDRPRVIISTDIGGTDPDDFQSMVHLLLYSDVLDIEGLIASPFGPGRKADILRVIDAYERDFPRLVTQSARYPRPDVLRAITKQGAIDRVGPPGVGVPSEGSDWLVHCARRDDPRPLYVLVWGGIEDLAQALHDAPDILPKLRVYFIGGPNKMWSVDAYNSIEVDHPDLWIIEANSTYRGWFVGGDQRGEWGNKGFVAEHIAGRGALGTFFATQLGGTIKMGDSPSVGYLLHGTPEDPSQPGWGGRFVRVWDERKTVFDRLTTEADRAEVFGVVEITLPVPEGFAANHTARMTFDNRVTVPGAIAGNRLRFRFAPRDAKVWTYTIVSSFAGLDGQSGRFTAVPPSSELTGRSSKAHPNWWTDDPDPAAAEGVHAGARSVNQWRVDFLHDFAARLQRCKVPNFLKR